MGSCLVSISAVIGCHQREAAHFRPGELSRSGWTTTKLQPDPWLRPHGRLFQLYASPGTTLDTDRKHTRSKPRIRIETEKHRPAHDVAVSIRIRGFERVCLRSVSR